MKLLFQTGIKIDINLTEVEEILYLIFEEFNFDKYTQSIYTAKIIDSFLDLSNDRFGELFFYVNNKTIKIILEKKNKKVLLFKHNKKISHFFISYLQDAIKIRKKYTLLVDTLTSLPNRKYFFKYLENAIKENSILNQKLAIAFLDIKDFKFINDFYGNEIGDFVLQTLANRIKKISLNNSFVARIGADQFVIVFKNFKNKEEIKKYINYFIKILEQPIEIEKYLIDINLFIGVSVFPSDGKNKDELLQAADLALYELKLLESKERVLFFSQQIKDNFLEEKNLEKDLEKAIKNNELLLFYQPKIDSRNNKIVGVEALLRWQHPKLGFIPNGKWIPILEKSKYLKEVGLWVLYTATKDIYNLNKEFNANIIVSVNVDIKEFTSSYYLDELKKLPLEIRKILILELLERKAVKYWDELLKMRSNLKKFSIKFSFDDFGTGNTTLQYLTKLLPDEIKVDRSFVTNIHLSNNKIITKAIIAMADSLDIHTIAEGVEKEEELKILNELGCFIIQGFLFAKPMPLEKLKLFIKKNISRN